MGQSPKIPMLARIYCHSLDAEAPVNAAWLPGLASAMQSRDGSIDRFIRVFGDYQSRDDGLWRLNFDRGVKWAVAEAGNLVVPATLGGRGGDGAHPAYHVEL